MLALERRKGEAIIIGDPDHPIAVVRINEIRSGNRVRIGIEAPQEIKITRKELVGIPRQGWRMKREGVA